MIRYTAKRLLFAIPVLWGLLTVTFFIVRLAPGDPTAMYLDPGIDPEAASQLKENLGLNESLGIQYARWLGVFAPFEGVLQGSWGISFSRHRAVFEIISEATVNTLILTITALLLDFVIGIFIGVTAAVRPHSIWDRTVTLFSLVIYSAPPFVLALGFILIFSLWLGWLPATQMHSAFAEDLSGLEYFGDLILHLIMPAIVLGIGGAASTARYVRSAMRDILKQDYIRTARAKGLSESVILWRHAFPNALIPVITLLGLSLPFLLSGAVITEVIFAWPGMGRVALDAILARDYPLIIANTFVAGGLVIVGNLLADLGYAWADPRVRLK